MFDFLRRKMEIKRLKTIKELEETDITENDVRLFEVFNNKINQEDFKNKRYILGTDTFDNQFFSVCIFDAENNSVVVSESIIGEKEFEERVKELSNYYDCSMIEEFEIKESSKNRVYAKIPNITQTIAEYLKTDKGKQVLKDFFY